MGCRGAVYSGVLLGGGGGVPHARAHTTTLEGKHQSDMVNFTILAGGYTTFVVSYLFNSDTNALTVLNQSPTGVNPSWLSLHPTNRSVL